MRDTVCNLLWSLRALPEVSFSKNVNCSVGVLKEKSCLFVFFLQVWISWNSSKLWDNVKRVHQTWTTCKNHFVVRTVLWFLQICRNVNIWHSFWCICHIQGNIYKNYRLLTMLATPINRCAVFPKPSLPPLSIYCCPLVGIKKTAYIQGCGKSRFTVYVKIYSCVIY